MQQININELKPHPRNNEFFDDMSGEKWKEFIESIKTRGVIEPIVITPDKVIVSGHQRVRACKELGIKTVMCDVHTYNSEDEILQDLLETNIRQRGDVGGSAKKVGLRIKELERIYGIKNGGSQFYGNQHGKVEKLPNNSEAPQLYHAIFHKSSQVKLDRKKKGTTYYIISNSLIYHLFIITVISVLISLISAWIVSSFSA